MQAVQTLFTDVQRAFSQSNRDPQAFARIVLDPTIGPSAEAEFYTCVDRVLLASKSQQVISKLLVFVAKCVVEVANSGKISQLPYNFIDVRIYGGTSYFAGTGCTDRVFPT